MTGRPPIPPHRARPLLAAADEPVDEVPAAHGLAAFIYPPAAGICTSCHHRADRLTRDDRICLDCRNAA